VESRGTKKAKSATPENTQEKEPENLGQRKSNRLNGRRK
jgi:hypothetical protein